MIIILICGILMGVPRQVQEPEGRDGFSCRKVICVSSFFFKSRQNFRHQFEWFMDLLFQYESRPRVFGASLAPIETFEGLWIYKTVIPVKSLTNIPLQDTCVNRKCPGITMGSNKLKGRIRGLRLFIIGS